VSESPSPWTIASYGAALGVAAVTGFLLLAIPVQLSASNVADHVMHLQIHLVQGFLYVMHVSRRHLHQTLPVAQQ
jgi:hypothetical protein